jgi:hypothetical protein
MVIPEKLLPLVSRRIFRAANGCRCGAKKYFVIEMQNGEGPRAAALFSNTGFPEAYIWFVFLAASIVAKQYL